jgi:hypothetical protein
MMHDYHRRHVTEDEDQNNSANKVVVVSGGFVGKIPVTHDKKSDTSDRSGVTKTNQYTYNPIFLAVASLFQDFVKGKILLTTYGCNRAGHIKSLDKVLGYTVYLWFY